MIFKIHYNKYIKKAVLKEVRLSRNKRWLIWIFESDNNEYRGITSSHISYGNKPYIWYSLLVGYFLPHAYTINIDNIIGKECYIKINKNNIVNSIIPIQNSSTNDEDIFI